MYLTINKPMKCVMARIVRQRQRHQKNFLISEYRTWTRAKEAAEKWVKAQLKVLPKAVSLTDRKTTRNTSGVVGVRLANATRRKDGNVYPDWRWVAFWKGCPKTGGIGWSVNKYGDKRAFVSAYIARAWLSVDREAIDAEVERRKGSPEYRAVLKLKRVSAP